jgi:hypothetical protein
MGFIILGGPCRLTCSTGISSRACKLLALFVLASPLREQGPSGCCYCYCVCVCVGRPGGAHPWPRCTRQESKCFDAFPFLDAGRLKVRQQASRHCTYLVYYVAFSTCRSLSLARETRESLERAIQFYQQGIYSLALVYHRYSHCKVCPSFIIV